MEDPGLFRESLRAALRPFQDEGTSLSPSAAIGYLLITMTSVLLTPARL